MCRQQYEFRYNSRLVCREHIRDVNGDVKDS
jgi:hypothetical protein